MQPDLILQTIVTSQFGLQLCLVVAGRLTQVEPGASKLGLTQQGVMVAFRPELSVVSMDSGLVHFKLVTVVGFFNAKAVDMV